MRLQGSSPPVLTEDRLRELTALGRNRITQLYLHWTAGRYGELYDYYHFNIDADGSIYHTCAFGALPHHGYDTDFGSYPPTPQQIDAAAKLVARLTDGLDLPVDRFTVLTHCEAALLDGYGPYSGDAETRWDLWYLRDSPGDGTMKPGGQVIRGKALWYACHKAEKTLSPVIL